VDSTLSSYQAEICCYTFVIELCGLRPYVITICNITFPIGDIEFDWCIKSPLWEVNILRKNKIGLTVCVRVWCSLLSETLSRRLHDKVSLSKEHQTHTQTYCNDIRPQTAQFPNERISTDLNLVTWQSTVHEPPEDGLKNGTETCRGKFF